MNIEPTSQISDNMKYHIDNEILISSNIFRYGSKSWSELICEARKLYEDGDVIEVDENEYDMINSNIGIIRIFEGREIMLDTPEPVWDTDLYEVYVQNENEILRIEFENTQ